MDADDLVRAIRAALDETERLAIDAKRGDGIWQYRDMRERDPDVYPWQVYAPDVRMPAGTGFAPAEALHIAHNDPAAVLRRVAADKRVLERHEPIDARVVLTSHVERQICAYCSDAAEHSTGDFSESEWLLDDEDQAVKWPCPDFTDLARGLGINPEETPQ